MVLGLLFTVLYTQATPDGLDVCAEKDKRKNKRWLRRQVNNTEWSIRTDKHESRIGASPITCSAGCSGGPR